MIFSNKFLKIGGLFYYRDVGQPKMVNITHMTVEIILKEFHLQL